MRFGLTERLGDFPGITIKVAPLDVDPYRIIAELTQRGPSDAEWMAFMAAARRSLNSNLGRFFQSKLSPDQFGDVVFTELLRAHAVAVAAGRQRAGILGALNELDKEVALFHGQQQGAYLEGFVRRLNEKSKRYWDEEKGEWKRGVINRDLQMYASRYRGSANIAFESNSPEGSEFYWRLGIAEHCPDCLELAAESPHTQGELPVFPGDGGTKCIVNCKCWLVRGDGVKAFEPDPGVGKYVEDAPEDGFNPLEDYVGETTGEVAVTEQDDTYTLPQSPVSAAIKYRKSAVKERIQSGVAIVDQVHSDGLLPKVVAGRFVDPNGLTAEGWYFTSVQSNEYYGRTVGFLNLKPTAAFPELTVVHEIGHILEIEILGAGTIVNRLSKPHWNDVGEALVMTAQVGGLLNARNQVGDRLRQAVSDGDLAFGAQLAEWLERLDYLLMPEEIWARAYAQFVTKRSGSDILGKQLAQRMRIEFERNLPTHWEDDDFGPVYQAIVKAMIAEGWIDEETD
ncbi:hypothetical protein CCB80_03220 [Armatimonadetes bacterium Uphvl-Ar1]|nr:hypothetical protein CCB80_03220 [Armatimonadetes bacterium Uphvl-Ar1]